MEIISKSLEETQTVAQNFLKDLPDKSQKAFVVGLRGNLGSGKTTFVQAIARELGVGDKITSPTFVIMKKYPTEDLKGFSTLIHIDAYRLDEARELAILGFTEEVSEPSNLIFIEWPENVSEALPANVTFINFEFIDETKRKITFNK
jgi:tRNA threonylcarbamoyladenosine biosynthesis protein TsaE